MDEKKKPIRRKGRAETIIEDLSKFGLRIVGVHLEKGEERIITIDSKDPYKNGGVFGECDLYRIYTSAGLPVVDKRHLSGVRKWIDGGDIERWAELAQKRQYETELRSLIGE